MSTFSSVVSDSAKRLETIPTYEQLSLRPVFVLGGGASIRCGRRVELGIDSQFVGGAAAMLNHGFPSLIAREVANRAAN